MSGCGGREVWAWREVWRGDDGEAAKEGSCMAAGDERLSGDGGRG